MKNKATCFLLALLISVLAVGPSFARTDDEPLTLDQKKAAAERKKAEEKKLAEDKRTAETAARKVADDKKKAEKAAAEAEKQSNKDKPAHSDIENIGHRNINKHSPNFTSIQNEIALGKQAAAEVERDVQLITDPVITEYVNRVGQNLVRHSDATQFTFTIKVVDSDEVNAFALPGGFFYVNSGLILAADDEAELAGVMAHEIAHVAARHATENQAKGNILQIALIPAIILSGGVLGTAVQETSQILLPVTMFQFSQGSEKEADFLGLQYMYAAGYDPAATISFFEKLQAKESPRKVSKLFATHPPTEERVKLEKKNIERVLPDREQYVVTTSEFDKVKARLAAQDVRKPAAEQKPSLRRGRTGGPADPDPDSRPRTRPEDRTPEPDDRPTLKRDPGTDTQ